MATTSSERAPEGWIGTRVQNLRRVRDSGMLNYPTVSLLFGKNSSGKTSLLRAPLILKQALDLVQGNEAILSGPYVDFGSYRDLVTDGLVSRDVEITAAISPPSDFSRRAMRNRIHPLLQPLFDGMLLDVTIHWNQRAGQAQFQRIAYRSLDSGDSLVDLTRTGPESFRVDIGHDFSYSVPLPLSLMSTRFIDLPPHDSERDQVSLSLGLYYLSMSVQNAAANLVHIGPLREVPQRSYRTEQLAANTHGDSAVAVLRSGEGLKAIENSLRALRMASEVKVQKLAPGFVAVSLHDPESGRADNLADVGFGVSQVLPILATLATAARGSTILIEQPELHLHPEAQAALADELYGLAVARDLRLVIETHSEHLLLRFQRRVAEEAIPPEKLAVYFVDGGVVTRAEVDTFGQIDSKAMPDGFFEEDWEDLMGRTQAAARRSQ